MFSLARRFAPPAAVLLQTARKYRPPGSYSSGSKSLMRPAT
jgi:hypothetical protein